MEVGGKLIWLVKALQPCVDGVVEGRITRFFVCFIIISTSLDWDPRIEQQHTVS